MELLESKSNEECAQILKVYQDRLKAVFGVKEINPDMIASQIQDQFELKLKEEFNTAFGDLNGPTLKTCLELLAKQKEANKPRIITGKK